MAVAALIDTSVATRLNHPQVREQLAHNVTLGRVGRPAVTDLEVGFSARSGSELGELTQALGVFPLVDTTLADWHAAADVQRRLAQNGQRGRKIPDLLIAAVAHRLRLRLWHYDSDFDLIAAHTGQDCQWVAPRGSID